VNGSQAIQVAVAVVRDAEGRLLWTFNRKWGLFCLPMTRCRQGQHAVEPPEQAAARAAAEALGAPVRIGRALAVLDHHGLSRRDFTRKEYTYAVYEAAWHPRYADRLELARPFLWLSPQEALSLEYQPLSAACLDIVTWLVEQEGQETIEQPPPL
jgi:hypothetical protein